MVSLISIWQKQFEKVNGELKEITVYEIEARCPYRGIPFRILVDPKIPEGTLSG